MAETDFRSCRTSGRRFADFFLFGVTATELALLFTLTPDLTLTDWIYLSQHVIVLVVALVRPAPRAHDSSLRSSLAVAVSYAYAYGQVIYLAYIPGNPVWPAAGLAIVIFAACLSLVSILSLNTMFGIRPALRGLVTRGPYTMVRHPMYLAYIIGDVGYNLQEWNSGTALLVAVGWASLLYRIHAEERVLSQHHGWPQYVASVRYRLLPGLW